MDGFNAFNIVMSVIAKLFLMAVFAAIYVVMRVAAKQRAWLSILLSLFVGMFMFMVIPMMTPLTSGFMNVIMCLAGGIIFSVVLGKAGTIVMQKGSVLS